jgi:23S rRNA (cytosine1962-C5)-methyltransferase
LRFEADVVRGQKTGFFLDQRENRRIVEGLARDRTVLNAFSFSGGFSLYAARGGAKSVTDLDISVHALTAAKRNLGLNKMNPALAGCRRELIQADAFDWLTGNAGRKFDLIVLDPPSLAKREAGARSNSGVPACGQAIKHLLPGGILVACSCSALSQRGVLRRGVLKRGEIRRKFVELQRTGHAPDHPATFREAEYLKAIYLRIE